MYVSNDYHSEPRGTVFQKQTMSIWWWDAILDAEYVDMVRTVLLHPMALTMAEW